MVNCPKTKFVGSQAKMYCLRIWGEMAMLAAIACGSTHTSGMRVPARRVPLVRSPPGRGRCQAWRGIRARVQWRHCGRETSACWTCSHLASIPVDRGGRERREPSPPRPTCRRCPRLCPETSGTGHYFFVYGFNRLCKITIHLLVQHIYLTHRLYLPCEHFKDWTRFRCGKNGGNFIMTAK